MGARASHCKVELPLVLPIGCQKAVEKCCEKCISSAGVVSTGNGALAMEGPPPLEEVESRCLATIDRRTSSSDRLNLTPGWRSEGSRASSLGLDTDGVQICWVAANNSPSFWGFFLSVQTGMGPCFDPERLSEVSALRLHAQTMYFSTPQLCPLFDRSRYQNSTAITVLHCA